jgi:hypothetical protein
MTNQIYLAKQRGGNILVIVFLLISLATLALSVMRIAPIYLENANVLKSIEQIKNQPEIKSYTTTRVKAKLISLFGMNEISLIDNDNFKQHFSFKRTSSGLNIIMKYSREAAFFKNILFLVKFEQDIILYE